METITAKLRSVDISRALQIEGWMSEGELTWLAEQANTNPRGQYVEVGTFYGRSARAIADHLVIDEPFSHSPAGRMYCVDPFIPFSDPVLSRADQTEMDEIYEECKENLHDLTQAGLVVFFRETSARAALRFRDHTLDMVFIDGNHNYRSVLNDITSWERTVKPGGLICGHDYNVHSGVKLAVDECFSYGRIKFPAGSIWAVRKPLSVNWDQVIEPGVKAARDSERLSAKDLAVRINAKE